MTDHTNFFEEDSLQPAIASLLQQEIITQSLSHAYLFVGPSGTGKKTLSRQFAQSILAQSDEGAAFFFQNKEPHPDLLFLSRPENKTVVTKAQITEELIPWLGYKPYRARNKIVLLHDAHCLSMEGANALLKILEEPPEYAVLLLVSDQETILETIRSRCRILFFHPIPEKDLIGFLKRKDPSCEEKKLQEIARISGNDASLALTLLTQDLSSLQKQALQLLESLQSGQRSSIFTLATALEKEGKPLFNCLLLLLRDRVLQNEIGDAFLPSFSGENRLPGDSALSSRTDLIKSWQRIQNVLRYSSSNVNPSSIAVNIAWEFYHCFEP